MFKHLCYLGYSIALVNAFISPSYAAPQSVYCPQKSGYINVGMTPDQVIAACGVPISQQQSNNPAMQQIPVQQLYFNNQGQSTAFYGVWAIPGGSGNYGMFQPFNSNNGGGGVQLQVDVTNGQVKGIKVNGSDTNAFSLCGGTNITVGDPASKVYNACGTPTLSNNTFINQPIPSQQKPIIWTYKPDPYGPTVTLTFVNGKLLSIQ